MRRNVSEPLVSAIVIFLNAERFLEEAIESIFSQTYGNWELMLVDDGSSDGSTAIAQRHAAALPSRVRYLEHPGHANRGMSASRNLGIRESRGDYVALLDADDVWLPYKLEEQVAILESQPSAGMVYGRTLYWHSWSGSGQIEDYTPDLGLPPNTVVEPPRLLSLFFSGRTRTPGPSNIMVRRSTIEEVGGFEERFRNLYEDQAFLIKVYLRAGVYVAGEQWFKFRRHSSSFMSVTRKAGAKQREGLIFLDWVEKYLVQQGIRDRKVWKALRKKQWRYRHPTLHRLRGWIRRPVRYAKTLVRRMAGEALSVLQRRLGKGFWGRAK